MGRNVAIVGTGQTNHKAKIEDMNIVEVINQAVRRCLMDAHATIDDVDAVLIGNMEHFEGIYLSDMWASDASGALGRFGAKITTGGTSGTSLAMAAYYYVASGLFDSVMCIGWEKQSEGDTTAGLLTVTDPIWERPSFAAAFGTFGAAATEYMDATGLTQEHAAIVAAQSRQNGLKNPYAHLHLDITAEDVLKSEMLSYPIHMLDLCPASDGACAMLFAGEDSTKKFQGKPAWVSACSSRHESTYVTDPPMFVDLRTLRLASKDAFKIAGITDPLKELDVLELYSASSWKEMSMLEALEVCEKGQIGELVENGVFSMDGELPVNPSGGVMCSNPIGATAMLRVAEAAIQIRGQGGERQLDGVKTAMATGYGGNWWSDVMILKSDLP